MSRLQILLYNPDNYKNTCNVFEESEYSCNKCVWEAGVHCLNPLYFRSDLEETLDGLSHVEL